MNRREKIAGFSKMNGTVILSGRAFRVELVTAREIFRIVLALPLIGMSRLAAAEPISVSSEVMGGAPVFSGTRVPVETLIEYLEGGDSIDDFLEGFPTVTREQVIGFLEQTRSMVLARSR